jgi:hypothetical protein
VRRRFTSLSLVVVLCLLVGAAHAQFPRDRKTILMRVEGYIGEKTPEPLPLTSWMLNDRERMQRFQVLHITVVQGDVSYDNIVTALEPYAYDDALTTLFLRGPATLLDQYAATPKHQRIAIIGYLHISPRQWNLSSIEVVAPPTPTGKRGDGELGDRE